MLVKLAALGKIGLLLGALYLVYRLLCALGNDDGDC